MKLFVFSDCHGFATELIQALDKAGFDKNNPEHFLIGCGDYLDRGREPLEILQFLNSIPNKILLKGNHETLLLKCLRRQYPAWNDYNNGTFHTISDLGHMGEGKPFEECCQYIETTMRRWIKPMPYYFETQHYVFVHSQVPQGPNWRTASVDEWEKAMWGNPYEFWDQITIPGKTVVFGHWHTSWPRAAWNFETEWDEGANFDIYQADGYIGIDGCTAYTDQVNILVLEDDFLESNNEEYADNDEEV